MPETLLTRNLAPFFETALATENSMADEVDYDRTKFNSLRKAPSLSTLGLPMMSIKAASRGLVRTLRSLISQLPIENQDVLRTVTELIWMISCVHHLPEPRILQEFSGARSLLRVKSEAPVYESCCVRTIGCWNT